MLDGTTIEVELTTRGGREHARLSLPAAFLEQYDVGEVLGNGAMGTVYRAVQISVRRPVAIKFLKGTRPDLIARFVREGRVLAKISHPAVTRVFDSGEIAGHRYLVTELLEGGTLTRKLEAGPLPWTQAQVLALQLLDGLSACHAAGIIHRDIKPDNILFGTDGKARLADLGIASDEGDAEALTATGAVIGTPLYMAPEQLKGGGTSERSDVWSMAALIFEMIKGHPPFTARSITELMLAHARPPASLDERVPRGFVDALHRALALDPAARHKSARDLAHALGTVKLASAGAVDSRPQPRGVASRPPPPPKARPRWAMAGVVLAVALGADFAVWSARHHAARNPQIIEMSPSAAAPRASLSDVRNAEEAFARALDLLRPEPQTFAPETVGDPIGDRRAYDEAVSRFLHLARTMDAAAVTGPRWHQLAVRARRLADPTPRAVDFLATTAEVQRALQSLGSGGDLYRDDCVRILNAELGSQLSRPGGAEPYRAALKRYFGEGDGPLDEDTLRIRLALADRAARIVNGLPPKIKSDPTAAETLRLALRTLALGRGPAPKETPTGR